MATQIHRSAGENTGFSPDGLDFLAIVLGRPVDLTPSLPDCPMCAPGEQRPRPGEAPAYCWTHAQ